MQIRPTWKSCGWIKYTPVKRGGDTLERGTIFHPIGFAGRVPRGWFRCKLYGYGIIVPAIERADRNQNAGIALGILLACCPSAFALDPSLDISQYAHTTWPVREGSFNGHTYTIAQTPDGYLWLGTDFGLLRFDGVRSVPWQPPKGEHLPSSSIRRLLTARGGRLWIGTDKGLTSWKDGKLTHYPELAEQAVVSLLEDRDGTVWAGGSGISTGRLCAIRSGGAHCYGEDGGLGQWVTSLYEDRGGNLWVGAATGLWRWKPGPPRLYPLSKP